MPIRVAEEHKIVITYTWDRDGNDIPAKSAGQYSNKLTIPKVVPADEGRYYCIAKQFGHCATSNMVKVTVDGEKISQSICISSYIPTDIQMFT